MRSQFGLLLLALLGCSQLHDVAVSAQAVKQQPGAAPLPAVAAVVAAKPAAAPGGATAAVVMAAKPAATAATTPPAAAKPATPAVAGTAAAGGASNTALPAPIKAPVVAATPVTPLKPIAATPTATLKPVAATPTATLKPVAATPTATLKPVATAPTAPAVKAPAAATPAVPASTANVPPPFIFKQPGATKTIKIGCAAPFEGDKASVGAAVVAGLEMAIRDKAPTLLPGVNVNLTCLNSKCVDIPAYMAVTRFADEKADAIVGEICSGASVAAAGVGNTKKLPIISPSSTSPALSQIDYFFRTVPSDRYQGVAAAKLVWNNGGKNAGLIYEDSSYGYGLAFSFIAGYTKLGGNVPVVYQFKPMTGNPAEAVAKIKQGVKDHKLDAVFISTNNLTFTAEVLVLAKAAGLTNLKYYAGDSQADQTLLKRIGGRPSVVDQLAATSPSYGSDAFVKAFAKETSGKVPYSPFAAHAYDAMEALLRAFRTNPKDGTALKAALQQQTFKGVSGDIAFDEFGDEKAGADSYVYSRFDAAKGSVNVQGVIS